jgi:hypothetical protein
VYVCVFVYVWVYCECGGAAGGTCIYCVYNFVCMSVCVCRGVCVCLYIVEGEDGRGGATFLCM